MKIGITIKDALLSIAYSFIIIILMLGINFLIVTLFEHVIFYMLDWFNRQELWIKIILLLLGVSGIFSLLFNLASLIANTITSYLLKTFPLNWFTLTTGILIGLTNSIICIKQLWEAIPFWNIWFIIEFIILAGFIISLSFIILPNKLDDKQELL